MTVYCSECGEELMGAVNRCWKCGREFEVLSRQALPPIRRPPLEPIVVASPADGDSSDPVAASTDQAVEPHTESETSRPAALDEAVAAANAPVRRGSPFAGGGEGIALKNPRSPHYPTDSAARGAAYSSVVVGAMAFAASFYTIGGVVVGLIGIGMGSWGLYSDRRIFAMIGIVLSCIAVAIASFNGAVDLYILIYGIDPFAPEIPEMDFLE